MVYVSSDKGRLEEIPQRIGLIAGEGNFPLMLAQAARSEGVEIYAFGVNGLASEELKRYAIHMEMLRLTDFTKLLQACARFGIRHLVMAGRVPHDILLLKQLSLDKRLLRLLANLRDRRADSLLRAVVEEFEREGIEVLDSTMFLKSCMPEPGLLTPRVPPSLEVLRDIEFAYPLAKEIGRLDIGQTVAVKNGVVVAVEALEGTDNLIKRCGDLAGEGVVLVKIAKPRQDMRFDVPVVGLTTIRNLAHSRAAALCITARQSLFFDRSEAVEMAEQNRICIIARDDDKPLSSHGLLSPGH